MEKSDNVIHVFFGDDGGYKIHTPEAIESDVQVKIETAPGDSSDPLAALYSRAETARLFDIKQGRLRYWDRTDFLSPSATRGRRKYYTFQDLIGIRAAKGLLDKGLPLQEVRRSVAAIRNALPLVVRPLSELRVVAEGAAMLVRDEGAAFEAQTGQLVLDFRVDSIREDVVRILRPERSDNTDAYSRYLEGCRLDEEESTFDEAEAAYRDAIRLDPALTNALTNLGNLRYRRGDQDGATRYYRQALQLDASHPEALYNLGFVAQDDGDDAAAISYFQAALRSDPAFADAHFNLGLALLADGRGSEAKEHWRAYLTLEPQGEWAPIAERHLQQ